MRSRQVGGVRGSGELALAAFAAETGGHFVSEPKDARYARFRERFDAEGFRSRLATAGIRWLASLGSCISPLGLRSIFDPPPGLFLRGAGGVELLDRAGRRDRRGAGLLVVRCARREGVRT